MVVDLGCGDQPYAFLAHSQNLEYVGVDLSLAHTPRPTVCADSLQLPFKDDSFDTVLSTQVIEHVPDPFVMLREMCRVLKPAGHLILTAPQAWPLHEEPHDFFRYTRFGLAELATRNGLRIVELQERGGAIRALGQISGSLLYDSLGKRAITRIPLKLAFIPFYACCSFLDRIFFTPKFTLGYVLVAEKPSRE
jgi:SAM-dependent methyltransferase